MPERAQECAELAALHFKNLELTLKKKDENKQKISTEVTGL